MGEYEAMVAYRQNDKLDSIKDTVLEKLGEKKDYDDVEVRVFPENYSEEDIADEMSGEDFGDVDLLLTDRTTHRSIGKPVDNMFNLDKLYEEASEYVSGRIKKKLQNIRIREKKERVVEEKDIESHHDKPGYDDVEKFAGAVDSFNVEIEKVYLAIPALGGHQLFRSTHAIHDREPDYREEAKSEIVNEYMDRLDSPDVAASELKKAEALMAEEVADELENEGYDVELVIDNISFDEMEENSVFLRDGHYNSYDDVADVEGFEREALKQGSKYQLISSAIYRGAAKTGLFELEEIDQEDREQIFQRSLESKLRRDISDLKHKDREIDEEYLF